MQSVTYKKGAALAKGQGSDRSSRRTRVREMDKAEEAAGPERRAHNRAVCRRGWDRLVEGAKIRTRRGSYDEVIAKSVSRAAPSFRRDTLYARIHRYVAYSWFEQPLRSLVQQVVVPLADISSFPLSSSRSPSELPVFDFLPVMLAARCFVPIMSSVVSVNFARYTPVA